MNIGRILFRQITRDLRHSTHCCHHHHDDIGSALIKAATVAAGVGVANEVIKRHYNPGGIRGAFEDFVRNNMNVSPAASAPARNAYADGILAKLAVCTYVARVDNSITGDEQLQLDMAVSDLLGIENLPRAYRDEVNMIRSSTDTSFASIQPYLDRVDGNVLISYLIDIQNIARASGGISQAEQQAINVYKNYVTRKTGYTFPEDSRDEIDLTCPGCGGIMELDTTYSRTICPYCGNTKIVDPDIISRNIR